MGSFSCCRLQTNTIIYQQFAGYLVDTLTHSHTHTPILSEEHSEEWRSTYIHTHVSESLSLTLNLMTSSIFAVFPSLTQLWKKLGATETPSASDVIPVRALSALVAITRNVPKRRTNNRWV